MKQFYDALKAKGIKLNKDFLESDDELFPLVIDAFEYGNVSRFINHSCNPNTKCINVHGGYRNPRIAKIYFFAKKDIKAG
jgi:SET domain-containing protein